MTNTEAIEIVSESLHRWGPQSQQHKALDLVLAAARRADTAGVWVVYHHDWGIQAHRVYADELEARRAAEHWQEVAFWPFGTELQKVKVYEK